MDYAKQVRDSIKKHGFHTTFVGGGDSPDFCYSTGIFVRFGIPELFLSSLPPNLCHELITQYVKRFRDKTPPLNSRIPAKEERFDYYLAPVETNALSDYVLASIKYYGENEFDYLQLIYPDTEMLFPHEPGYDYDQEIIGTFRPGDPPRR